MVVDDDDDNVDEEDDDDDDDDDPPHSGGGVEEINAIFPSPATFGRADSKTSQQVDTPPPV